jgi:hypothetical protein
LTEPPPLPRCERWGLWLTSVVVQSSDPRWGGCTHIFLKRRIRPVAQIGLTQHNLPSRPRTDIVGWPDEPFIDFPNSADCTEPLKNGPTPKTDEGRSIAISLMIGLFPLDPGNAPDEGR